jgi:hypothetical protein
VCWAGTHRCVGHQRQPSPQGQPRRYVPECRCWGVAEAGLGPARRDEAPAFAYAGVVGMAVPGTAVRRDVIPAGGSELTTEIAA